MLLYILLNDGIESTSKDPIRDSIEMGLPALKAQASYSVFLYGFQVVCSSRIKVQTDWNLMVFEKLEFVPEK